MINDRVDIALASNADGVHVGSEDLPVARKSGVSRATAFWSERLPARPMDITTAIADGASTIGIGPMFVSTTKPELTPVGPERLHELLPALGACPHLAVGGIDAMNVSNVREAGGRGIAVCSGICDADDPEAATAAFMAAMGDPLPDQSIASQPVHGHA